jgi:hypothetical protein
MSFIGRFRKGDNDDKDVVIVETSTAGLARKILRDGLLRYIGEDYIDVKDVEDRLGLPPISEEVADMELAASDVRYEGLDALVPLLAMHSSIQSRILIEWYRTAPRESDDQDFSEVEEYLSKFAMTVSIVSTTSVLAMLKDLGIIDINTITGQGFVNE